MSTTAYETVIGLEVHAQLRTNSKIFCHCSTHYGAGPNTQTCPVCLGLPGSLPVLNREAVRFAVLTGLALGCEIRTLSHTARKNYFYPDLPKGYQISQFDEPLCSGGRMPIELDGRQKEIGITRIHIEEDAGKSLHGFGEGTAVDFNRCGVGLIEIVSEPEMTSPAEARSYLSGLKQLLSYLGISDCNMEEGSLRVDANVSLRPRGSEVLGTKTEVKNMNSFRAAENALTAEIARQEAILLEGGVIKQVTMLWNEAKAELAVMRSKEESHDYRYFPEPDLVPLTLSREEIAHIKAELPELPDARRSRFKKQYHLSGEVLHTLTARAELADYFEAVTAAGAPDQLAGNWISTEVLRYLHDSGQDIHAFAVTAISLSGLLKQVADDTISQTAAKTIFESMLAEPETPVSELIERSGLAQLSDREELEDLIKDVLQEYPDELERYRAGQRQLMGFFMGRIMQRSQGKANPKMAQELLQKLL